MDIKAMTSHIPGWIKRYRYPILILFVGLLLMLLPAQKTSEAEIPKVEAKEETVSPSDRLAGILRQIHGVGKVEVLLTVRVGETVVYQTDEDITTGETTGTVRKETVIITGADRVQQALVSQIIAPEYLGAVIVCQGGDLVQVKAAVVEAVSKATGLGADKITVLKMK